MNRIQENDGNLLESVGLLSLEGAPCLALETILILGNDALGNIGGHFLYSA